MSLITSTLFLFKSIYMLIKFLTTKLQNIFMQYHIFTFLVTVLKSLKKRKSQKERQLLILTNFQICENLRLQDVPPSNSQN